MTYHLAIQEYDVTRKDISGIINRDLTDFRDKHWYLDTIRRLDSEHLHHFDLLCASSMDKFAPSFSTNNYPDVKLL